MVSNEFGGCKSQSGDNALKGLGRRWPMDIDAP